MNRQVLSIGGVIIVGTTALFLLRGQANQVAPEPTTPQRTITAIGSATVTGKPDSARVFFEVITTDKTIVAARKELYRRRNGSMTVS